jgi:hypothetical protein
MLATIGDVLLAAFRPFSASLNDALTHGARFFVPYWSPCVSISAGMPLGFEADRWFSQKAVCVDFTTLPTTLIGNDVRYPKCTSHSSHAPKASSVASRLLSIFSKISILLS